MSPLRTVPWVFTRNKASRWRKRMWKTPRSKMTTCILRTSTVPCLSISEVSDRSAGGQRRNSRRSLSQAARLTIGTPRPIIAMNRRHTTTAIPFSSTSQAVPVYTLPGFPSFGDVDIGQYNSSASAFWQSFCQHLDLLAGYMRSLRFDQFEFAVSHDALHYQIYPYILRLA